MGKGEGLVGSWEGKDVNLRLSEKIEHQNKQTTSTFTTLHLPSIQEPLRDLRPPHG